MSLVNPDQTGFISGRHSSSNTRRLLNILYSPSTDSPELVLSLDTEKAFDRVEWRCLFYVLNKFSLSSDFVDWIKLLYASALASVSTNGIKSRPFSLHRGTRQGCPLSPLLFALAVEPLAIWLQSENGFEGDTCHVQLHKIYFYADDLLLYISNPASSLPIILDNFEKFGKYSGYKLNLGKSDYIPINSALTFSLMVSSPLGRL